MSRGLGKVQRALLNYFAQLPDGGGKLYDYRRATDRLKEFKVQHYHEIYGSKPDYYTTINWKTKERECRLYGGGVFDYHAYKRAQNKIRVTISLATKGLLRRGFLRSVPEFAPDDQYFRYGIKEIYITDEGRKVIL